VIRGLQFHGYHGVYEQEKRDGQLFRVHLKLHTDLRRSAGSDALADTIDYDRVHDCLAEVMTGRDQQSGRRDLLEAVADNIASTLLHHFRRITVVDVEVEKPGVAWATPMDWVGVHMSRQRSRFGPTAYNYIGSWEKGI
jgi:dihydroneopterin aldolase